MGKGIFCQIRLHVELALYSHPCFWESLSYLPTNVFTTKDNIMKTNLSFCQPKSLAQRDQENKNSCKCEPCRVHSCVTSIIYLRQKNRLTWRPKRLLTFVSAQESPFSIHYKVGLFVRKKEKQYTQ